MDPPPPSTIIFISHLLRCEEDASELGEINRGSFSYETQTEGKVITMTFLTSLKPFLHLLVAPGGLFSSLRVTNKYLKDTRCCYTTRRVTVTVVKVLLRSFHKRTFRSFSSSSYLEFPSIVVSHLHLNPVPVLGSPPAKQSMLVYYPDLFLTLTEQPHISVSVSLLTNLIAIYHGSPGRHANHVWSSSSAEGGGDAPEAVTYESNLSTVAV